MNTLVTSRRIFFAILLSIPMLLNAQVDKPVKTTKPYRIVTAGKQVTVKSLKDIKTLMVWTASGHRIIEEKELNASSYVFRINMNEKYFFMMLQLTDGKVHTEKIGVP